MSIFFSHYLTFFAIFTLENPRPYIDLLGYAWPHLTFLTVARERHRLF
jgi:hypothetical protein